MPTQPPVTRRVAVWVLRRALGPSRADVVLGDLDEELARGLPRRRPFAGPRLLWRAAAFAVGVRWAEFRVGAPRSARLLDRWRLDVRHAWRALSMRPGANLAAVGVFALGIGLVSVMFALTDRFVVRPLPYASPDELVVIEVDDEGLTPDAALPSVDDWRARTDLFVGLAAWQSGERRRLTLPTGAQWFSVDRVSPNLFEVLGVPAPRPATWRVDEGAAATPVLLTSSGIDALSEALRAGRYLLRADEGGDVVVAGSLPSAFLFPDNRPADGLAPYHTGLVIDVVELRGRVFFNSRPTMIARLQSGVTAETVRSALSMPLPSGDRLAVSVERLSDRLTQEVRPMALGALAAGTLVLLVCAGNIANLQMARGIYRLRELATRTALGATRGDILRLQIVELGLVALIALAAGLVVAKWAIGAMTQVMPGQYVALGTPVLDWRVTTFAVLAGAAVVVVGAVPGILVSRLAARASRAGDTGKGVSGPRVRVIRVAFAATQSGLAMVLVVGAAMLVQSYANLIRQDVGYDERTVEVRVEYTRDSRQGVPPQHVFGTVGDLRRIPGVIAAGVVEDPVVRRGMSTSGFRINGEETQAETTDIGPDLIEAAGMTLVVGRPLTAADGRGAVLVNEAFAREHWPDVPPLGQPVSADGEAAVVGVVRDVFDRTLDERPSPRLYRLMSAGPDDLKDRVSYVVRPAPGQTIDYGELRRAVSRMAPGAVIARIGAIGDQLGDTVRERTFAMMVLVLFGLAGSLVTVAGLVSIVSFVIARRTREIAIRVAIGAGTRHVRRLVTQEATIAAFVGGAAGLLAGQWLSTWLENLVYGIEAGNWTTTGLSGLVMAITMAAAARVAATRALRVEAAIALRVE